LSCFGASSAKYLDDIRDIADNPNEKEYYILDAKPAVSSIEEALRIREESAVHRCIRCSAEVESDEFARSMKMFQKIYCDRCFDEVYLKRRNFDTAVEINKNIRAKDETFVQSDGGRRIAEWLSANNIACRYDERFRIIEGTAVRPDFYLPEFDVYIEYWGMDTADYKIGMLKKQKLYQQASKKLISLYPEDKKNPDAALRQKLEKYTEK